MVYIYIYIYTMMTSYFKGANQCLFWHIHLHGRFGIWVSLINGMEYGLECGMEWNSFSSI